jgi:translocation and assembly module TamA
METGQKLGVGLLVRRFGPAMCLVLGVLLGQPTSALAEEPRVRIVGIDNVKLREALERAVGYRNQPPANRFEARRWANDAAEAAEALLRSEGYYGSSVIPDVSDDDTNEPILSIQSGIRFKFDDPQIEWVTITPTAGAQAAAEQIIGITIGTAGRAPEVIAAEGRIVAAVQKRGYADATAEPRKVTVDHAINTVQPTFLIAPGERVLLDGLVIQGRGRTKQAYIERQVPWKSGDVFDPDWLATLETRLQDTGVFDSVSVSLSPQADAVTGKRPVLLNLTERSRRTLETSIGFSTTDGPGLDLRWLRFNQRGLADTLTYVLKLAQSGQKIDAEIAMPHWRKPQETLKIGAGVYGDNTDAYDQVGIGARLDLTRRFGATEYIKTYLTYGASADYSRTYEKVRVNSSLVRGEHRDIGTLTALLAFALDRSSDPLDPKRGWRLESRSEPSLLFGDVNTTFVKVSSQASTYLPLDAKAENLVAARLKVGSILGGSIGSVPATRRFYAGGGSSVRGYGYQAIGPRLADNTPEGGLSVLEASAEFRHHFFGPWGGVAFIDAGAVGTDQLPAGKDVSLGAGIGLRYDLGFGPIRVDVAFPLDRRTSDAAFQLYLSIGQSF